MKTKLNSTVKLLPSSKEDDKLIMQFVDFIINSKLQMSASIYETALVASIKDADNKPLYPELLAQMITLQSKEWRNLSIRKGSAVSHQAFLCTLVLVNALLKFNTNQEHDECIGKGIQFIQKCIPIIKDDTINFVGSEMIIPAQIELLIEQTNGRTDLLHQENIPILKSLLSNYESIRKYKLDNFSMKRPSATWFSLEALPQNLLDINILNHFINKNGQFMSSPSGTAAIYKMNPDPRILKYFEEAKNATANKGLPITYPMNIFESIWIIGALINSDFSNQFITKNFKPLLDMIEGNFSDNGTGSAKDFPPDCDDTSRAVFSFSYLNVNSKYTVETLKQWYVENGKYFKTYHHEKDASMSANVHTLQAFLESNDVSKTEKEHLWDSILTLLENNAIKESPTNIYWTDKWMSSPLYTAEGVIYTIINYQDQFPQRKTNIHHKAINWILTRQTDSGGFETYAEYGPTMEETAYALIALVHYVRYYKDQEILQNVEENTAFVQKLRVSIKKGFSFLEKNKEQIMNIDAHPPLWTCKALFTPYKISISYVLGAYFLSKHFLSQEELNLQKNSLSA